MMEGKMMDRDQQALCALCIRFREQLNARLYKDCESQIAAAMRDYPHAAQPHNLMGVLMEAEDDHAGAMRHFRAAWALDPTYRPARYNMERTGTFYSAGACAIDESDCPAPQDRPRYKVEYDAQGIGHVVRRK